MNVYVLDTSYEPIAVVDTFSSLIWTKRYYTCGDFELYVPADKRLLDILKPDYYLIRDDDDSVMIIEKLEIQTDVEDGDYYIVSGRSLESILLRRVFAGQFILDNSGTMSDAVQAMVTFCTTDWSVLRTDRQIPGLTVAANELDGAMKVQFTGQTLLDGITSICQQRGLGIKMTIEGTNLVITIYEGSEVNVVFSPEFDNMINSKYVFDKTMLANEAMIGGEGEGNERQWSNVRRGSTRYSGLARREIFVDARDVSSNNGEIGAQDYIAMMNARGYEKLADSTIEKTFEAQIEPRVSFIYKTDYNLGDIVTATNEYGVTAKPRIVEIVESWDETGYTAIPTFDALEV